jgi:hypothetical protein
VMRVRVLSKHGGDPGLRACDARLDRPGGMEWCTLKRFQWVNNDRDRKRRMVGCLVRSFVWPN